MVLRMLRVAIPSGSLDGTRPATRPRRWPCCTRSAAFRPTGAPSGPRRRSEPVVRFLLFDSAYPGSVASSVAALAAALTAADAQPRSSPPVLRLGRLIADLELQRRAPDAGGALEEIARAGTGRAGAGRSRHRRTVFCDRRPGRRSPLTVAPRPHTEMNFAIRYLTEYDYDADVVDNLNALRVKPHGNGRQRCDEFSVRLTPEVRLHRHTDYFGTEVVEFEVSRPHRQLTIDVRARVSTKASAEPPHATWEALPDPRLPRGGRGVPAADRRRSRSSRAPGAARARPGAASTPLATVLLSSELIPDRFEYRQGATYVDSRDLRPARGRRGRLPGLRPPRAVPAAPPRDRRPLRVRLPVRRRLRRQPRVGRGRHPRLAGGAAARAPDGGEPVWVGADPTNRVLAGETHVKIGHGRHYADVPPIKGVYRGRRQRQARRQRHHDAAGAHGPGVDRPLLSGPGRSLGRLGGRCDGPARRRGARRSPGPATAQLRVRR